MTPRHCFQTGTSLPHDTSPHPLGYFQYSHSENKLKYPIKHYIFPNRATPFFTSAWYSKQFTPQYHSITARCDTFLSSPHLPQNTFQTFLVKNFVSTHSFGFSQAIHTTVKHYNYSLTPLSHRPISPKTLLDISCLKFYFRSFIRVFASNSRHRVFKTLLGLSLFW
jgi:hypothetical protein